MKVKIKLLRRLRGDDPGTFWRVSHGEALVLTHRGYAEYVTAAVKPQVAEVQQVHADAEETQQQEDVEISERTGLPKRQYRRRDLTAE